MATYLGLDLFSTGHQARISQVPLTLSLSFKQRPVLTPAAQTSQKGSRRAAISSPCPQGAQKQGAFLCCPPGTPSQLEQPLPCCFSGQPGVLQPSLHGATSQA